MSKYQTGSKNGQWKGGRTITPHGYVLLRMPWHHLADCRGYVYEHRLIAEAKLNRQLAPGEIAHHDNEIRVDNAPTNIIPVASTALHRLKHRKPGSKLRLPDEPNVEVTCSCGCGQCLSKYDALGRPRRYISGHNMRSSRG